MPRRVGYLRLRWCSMAWTAKRRLKPAAWTVRPCGTGCTVTTPRDWPGFAISNRRVAGSKLTARQQAELAELVEAGPDPAVHGVVRWRRVDLRDELQRRFGVALHERSVGKVLAKLGYRKLSVRPRHPQADEEAQETFKKTSPRQSRRKSPTAPKASRSKSGSKMRPGSASRAR